MPYGASQPQDSPFQTFDWTDPQKNTQTLEQLQATGKGLSGIHAAAFHDKLKRYQTHSYARSQFDGLRQQSMGFSGGPLWDEGQMKYLDPAKAAAMGLDPKGQYFELYDTDRRAGQGQKRDRMVVTYQRQGNKAVPVAYQQADRKSSWVKFRESFLKPVATAALAAYLGPAVAGAAGGGATGAVAGGAAVGGASAAINGGNILKGALTGGLTGGFGSAVGAMAPSLTNGLGTFGSGLVTGAIGGAGAAAITGGDWRSGALTGGLRGGLTAANVGGYLSDNRVFAGGINGALGSGLRAALTGGNVGSSLFTGGITGGISGLSGGQRAGTTPTQQRVPTFGDTGQIAGKTSLGGSMDDYSFGAQFGDLGGDGAGTNYLGLSGAGSWFDAPASDGQASFVDSGGDWWNQSNPFLADQTGGGFLSAAGDFVKSNPALIGRLVTGAAGLAAAGRPPGVDPAVGAAMTTSAGLSTRQMQLAELQYADQRDLFEQYAPLLKQQFTMQLAEQGKSNVRADDQWSSYLANFRPLETKMAKTAAEFDTPERRELEARNAAGSVGDRFQAARDQQTQAQFSAGIQPGSGRALALENASRIEEAKAKAGASNQARESVETRGLALVDNAARFGRNMPSTGIATAALAGQQGQQAGQQYSGLVNATAAPSAASAPLFQGALSANNSAASIGLNSAAAESRQYEQKAGLIGDLLSAGLTAYGYYKP